MCGRYALPIDPETLPEWFARQHVPLESVENAEKRTKHQYNIGPTAYAPVYMKEEDKESKSDVPAGKIEYMRWGIVPSGITRTSELKKSFYSTFNARFEKLTSNRTWKGNLSHRCVIPISGYYEWQQTDEKKNASNKKNKKIPYYIRRKDGELMFLAGLYHHGELEVDDATDNNEKRGAKKEGKKEDVGSYTIITREAPEMLKWLHSRMPVVLRPQDKAFTQWLDGEGTSEKDLDQLLKKYEHEEDLEWYPVDPAVGNIRTDSEKYVQPWKKKEPLTAFFKPKSAVKRERSDGDDDEADNDNRVKKEEDKRDTKKRKIKEEDVT